MEAQLKVFWSWQDDLPRKVARTFVQDALTDALANVAKELDLSPAERPELDHDTKGEAGLAEIVRTIFEKIERAALFVADVSTIAKTQQGKHVQNPNVMIELGHALTVLGHKPIILVANVAYGGMPEHLPFDLKHRRGAITYRLRGDADEKECSEAKAQLVPELADAIRTNLAAALGKMDAAKEFDIYQSPTADRSIWLGRDELIEHGDYFGNAEQHTVRVSGDVRCYARLAPAGWANKKPTRLEIQQARGRVPFYPMGSAPSGDGGANALGVVACGIYRADSSATPNATQWFDKTGEIWGFNSVITDSVDGQIVLGHYRVLKDWQVAIQRGLELYGHFKALGPLRIEIGASGLRKTHWAAGLKSERVPALEDRVSLVRTSRDWSEKAILEFLTNAYGELCTAFNRPPLPTTAVGSILNAMSA